MGGAMERGLKVIFTEGLKRDVADAGGVEEVVAVFGGEMKACGESD